MSPGELDPRRQAHCALITGEGSEEPLVPYQRCVITGSRFWPVLTYLPAAP